MFQSDEAFSSYSVHDMEKARAFYEDLLQLKVDAQEYMMELHLPGSYKVLLYPKNNHEPATFTVLNFKVNNIETTVKELKDKGVAFESYDIPGIKTDEHNIFTVKEMNMKQAWFKDPAGNILSVIEG